MNSSTVCLKYFEEGKTVVRSFPSLTSAMSAAAHLPVSKTGYKVIVSGVEDLTEAAKGLGIHFLDKDGHPVPGPVGYFDDLPEVVSRHFGILEIHRHGPECGDVSARVQSEDKFKAFKDLLNRLAAGLFE